MITALNIDPTLIQQDIRARNALKSAILDGRIACVKIITEAGTGNEDIAIRYSRILIRYQQLSRRMRSKEWAGLVRDLNSLLPMIELGRQILTARHLDWLASL